MLGGVGIQIEKEGSRVWGEVQPEVPSLPRLTFVQRMFLASKAEPTYSVTTLLLLLNKPSQAVFSILLQHNFCSSEKRTGHVLCPVRMWNRSGPRRKWNRLYFVWSCAGHHNNHCTTSVLQWRRRIPCGRKKNYRGMQSWRSRCNHRQDRGSSYMIRVEVCTTVSQS